MAQDYEVLAVRYATRATKASEVFLNFHVYGQADFDLTMDYFFWVARNDEHTIVIDTGFKRSVGEARGRVMTTEVQDGLKRIGVDPLSVNVVVITHCHYDHTGNLDLFPNAEVVISETEFDFWTSDLAQRFQFKMSAEAEDIDLLRQLDARGKVRKFSGELELTPGIKLIEVGGHTPGELIAVITNSDKPILLTSDAVHYYKEVDADWPFIIASNLPEFYLALDEVARLAAMPGAAYVAGHDPLVLDRFPPIDINEPGFGVIVS